MASRRKDEDSGEAHQPEVTVAAWAHITVLLSQSKEDDSEPNF